ncbi:hypothetical protein CC1G_13626 [Coprinopsis cinerea okayama7|uniref:Uncharacterized protein n=1 Tax=Coprinopsis cinerea (strain Okayama-7 / 130 / ATCC MYA-4618 / FGSC 9003) TaxID=240176 RepID=D6RK03_COPC7|nr:hypothetical protein CC1G_13626 [Coprinopsis cinerea okayama7\|eukprot:XP_002912093.1 hypothetical protein CC1G_13626 [Coprinopsis cinerea okayama7\
MSVKELVRLYESSPTVAADEGSGDYNRPGSESTETTATTTATDSTRHPSAISTSTASTLIPTPARFIRHSIPSQPTTDPLLNSPNEHNGTQFTNHDHNTTLVPPSNTLRRPGLPPRTSTLRFLDSLPEDNSSLFPNDPGGDARHTYPPHIHIKLPNGSRLAPNANHNSNHDTPKSPAGPHSYFTRGTTTTTITSTSGTSTRSHIPIPATTVFARNAAPVHLPRLNKYLSNMPKPEFLESLHSLQQDGDMKGREAVTVEEDDEEEGDEDEDGLLNAQGKKKREGKKKEKRKNDKGKKGKEALKGKMFPPMDKLKECGSSLEDLEFNSSIIPVWRDRKTLLRTSMNILIGFLGSSAIASFYSLQGLVNTVQVFALILSTIVPSNIDVWDKWKQLFLGKIPNVLALNFASTLVQSLLYLIIFMVLAASLLYHFYRSTLQCKRYTTLEGLQQTETQGRQIGLVLTTFLLTVIYLPLSTMAVHVIVWSEELWPVPNPYTNTTTFPPLVEPLGPSEEFRNPMDFCWTTTMKRNEVNYAPVMVILGAVTFLLLGIWFPLALRRVIRLSVPKVEKYSGMGRIRSSADLDAEYHRLLERDRNPFAFLYSAFRRGWGTYSSTYLFAKLSTLVIIAVMDTNNCLFHSFSSHRTIPVARQIILLISTIGFFIAQSVYAPFLDPVNNASEWTSRLNYVSTATTALLVQLDVPGKEVVETYVLYSIYVVTYGLGFYFAVINVGFTQRIVKRLTRRIDFSIDIFSPRLDVSPSSVHIRRRIWQESVTTLLLTDPHCRIPSSQPMFFAQASCSSSPSSSPDTNHQHDNPEYPPYLLNFTGTPGERHAENMKILREVGDMSYRQAAALLNGPDYAWFKYLEEQIQKWYLGPDSYWRPPDQGDCGVEDELDGSEGGCKSYFGNAWWIPFPPTLVIRYDDGPTAVVKDVPDLEAYIAQNSDPVIQQRKQIRLSLRALDGKRVYWPYEHKQPIGTSKWFWNRRGNFKATTSTHYRTATFTLKHTGFLLWQGVHLGSGFTPSLSYTKHLILPASSTIGLTHTFDLTAPLAKFLTLNQNLIEEHLPRIEEAMQSYRLYHRKECKWKARVLSYRFLMHVWAQPRDPTGLPQSSIEFERDGRVRGLMLGSGEVFRSTYERYVAVARSEAATWWYIFWDDLWRRNHDTIAGLRRYEEDFNPHYMSSIAYTPLPRPALEAFLTQRGLLHKKPKLFDFFHSGFLNKLYIRLNDCVFRDSQRAVMFHLGHDRRELDMEEIDALTQGNPSTLGTGGGTDHDVSWIRTRPTYRWEGLLSDPVRKREWGQRRWFAKLGAWFGLTPVWRSGVVSNGLSVDVRLDEHGRYVLLDDASTVDSKSVRSAGAVR